MRSVSKSGGRRASYTALSWVIGLAFIPGFASRLEAQNDLPVDQQANLVAEINLERFRASPIGEAIHAEDLLDGLRGVLGDFGGLEWNRVLRVRISARLPKDVSSVMDAGMSADKLPFQFLVLISASDPSALESWKTQIKEDSEIEQVDGMEFYRPLNGPGNLGAVFSDDSTIAIGTDDYLKRTGSTVASDSLLDLWKGMPDGNVRIVGDLQQCKELFDELQQMGGMAPLEIATLLEALPQIASLTVLQDFEATQLLAVRATGRTPESAETIRGLLDSLAGMIRDHAKDVASTPMAMRPMADLMSDIAAGTKVSAEPNGASMSVAMPINFANRIRDDILPLIKAERAQAGKMNDMMQICLAMHNYYEVNRRFPQLPDPNSKGKISWRVHVLPYLEEVELFQQVDFDQDAESAANRFLADKMPRIFGDDGRNTFVVAVRTDKQPASFQDITDGTSNTIAFVRLNEPVPWASDRDITIEQVVKMFVSMNGQGSVLAGLYDGSVRVIPADTDPDRLRALLTPAGGEVINW